MGEFRLCGTIDLDQIDSEELDVTGSFRKSPFIGNCHVRVNLREGICGNSLCLHSHLDIR